MYFGMAAGKNWIGTADGIFERRSLGDDEKGKR